MNPEKMASMSKTLKWSMMLLGVLCMGFAAMALLLQMEDATAKSNILVFACFGIAGVLVMVLGLALSSLFDGLAYLSEHASSKSAEDDSDCDIIA